MNTGLRLGGLCSLLFAGLWAVGTTLYLVAVGSPGPPASNEALIEAMRHPAYRAAFLWVWPAAWIASLVVAPAFFIHLRDRAPASSLAGMMFLLANAIYQFLVGAPSLAAISVAQTDPVDQAKLRLFQALSSASYPYLITVAALALLSWGMALRKGAGLERLAGVSFLVAFVSALAWKALGAGVLAEAMHETMVVTGLIVPYGAMGIVLLRGKPVREPMVADGASP